MNFFLIDKKECLVIEIKDDAKEGSYIAGESSICSTGKSIVHSYASIIKKLLRQIVAYDQSKGLIIDSFLLLSTTLKFKNNLT
jgi:hypothetical protein